MKKSSFFRSFLRRYPRRSPFPPNSIPVFLEIDGDTICLDLAAANRLLFIGAASLPLARAVASQTAKAGAAIWEIDAPGQFETLCADFARVRTAYCESIMIFETIRKSADSKRKEKLFADYRTVVAGSEFAPPVVAVLADADALFALSPEAAERLDEMLTWGSLHRLYFIARTALPFERLPVSLRLASVKIEILPEEGADGKNAEISYWRDPQRIRFRLPPLETPI